MFTLVNKKTIFQSSSDMIVLLNIEDNQGGVGNLVRIFSLIIVSLFKDAHDCTLHLENHRMIYW